MAEFTEIDFKIKSEIYKILELLGANYDLLAVIGSWKETLDDEMILSHLKEWKEKLLIKVGLK